jgi:hypothetical protein
MKLLQPGVAALAILLLAGCGRGDGTPGQPSAEERRALDNIAAKQDAEGAETFDTSPDSLVPAEGSAPAANEAAPANAAGTNILNASGNAAAGNSAAPR